MKENSSSRDHAPKTCSALEGWVSVEDKLPGEQGQDSENVLLFLNGNCGLLDHEARRGGGWGISMGWYDAEKGAFRAHGRIDHFVTHWMPLPAPPSSAKPIVSDKTRDTK